MNASPHRPARASSANRLRLLYKIPWIIGVFLGASLDAIRLNSKQASDQEAALYTQKEARRFLRMFNVRYTVEGEQPPHGVIVSNHVSYLDILVMAASTPALFVSKSEVRGYPWLGWLTAAAHTIYIDRNRSARTQQVGQEVEDGLRGGVPVAFYPEGTTTGGDTLLRFRAALFAPAVRMQLPVTPAAVRYELDGGSVRDEVAYWGEMEMLPHMIHLFALKEIRATLRFGKPFVPEQSGTVEQAARDAANHAQKQVAEMLGVTPEAPA